MATLNIPYTFTAGTPAIAAEVNANFEAIVNWTTGGLDTNSFGLLTTRTLPLLSAPLPLNTILPIFQTSAEPSIYIVNDSQGVPLTIEQQQAFGTPGKAVIKITDSNAQTQSGSPTVWLALASGATAPALLVQHGSVDTMRLTKTQLDLFNSAVQATSTGAINSIDTLTITSPAASAVALKLKGRGSDNNAVLQFKSNDDVTVYASATSSASGLSLNLPDTADTYSFKVNNVDKVIIDNDGIDGQYLTNASVAKNKMVAVGHQTVTPNDFSLTATAGGGINLPVGPTAIPGASITLTTTGRPVILSIQGQVRADNGGSGHKDIRGAIYLYRNSNLIQTYEGGDFCATTTQGGDAGARITWFPLGTFYLDPVAAGTYTYSLSLYGYTGNAIGGGGVTTNAYSFGIKFTAYEL